MKKLFLILFILSFPFFTIYGQSKIKSVGEPEVISQKDIIFSRPSWSPTGDKLAFTGPKNKGIWILDLSSDKAPFLLRIIVYPGASPDTPVRQQPRCHITHPH